MIFGSLWKLGFCDVPRYPFMNNFIIGFIWFIVSSMFFSNSWHFPSHRWDWSSCDACSSIGPLRQFGFFMGTCITVSKLHEVIGERSFWPPMTTYFAVYWTVLLLAPCLRQDPPLRLGFSNVVRLRSIGSLWQRSIHWCWWIMSDIIQDIKCFAGGMHMPVS